MIFICLKPQYKIVISLDVIKITDKYCVSCYPPRRGVGPLEVRFAHPVRLSPDTHSQGEGTEKESCLTAI